MIEHKLIRTTLLTLGLYPSSGGPAKSIRAFRDALSASVISWVDPIQVGREALIWDETLRIQGSRLPVLRQLLVPPLTGKQDAERIVAQSNLVSCHSFWRWHVAWLRQTSRKHGVPYWFVPHGSLDPYVFENGNVVKQLFLRYAGRPFIRDAAAIVCSTRREFEKLGDIAKGKAYAIIPWPLDEEDFRNRNLNARRRVRAQLGIPEDAFCLLYFGRLHLMKRPLETIAALADADVADAHLIVVGNEFGVTQDECRRKAEASGIGDRVHVIGPVYGQERYAYLDAVDIYISLSSRENFNFTAAESLASGLPVILSPGNDLGGELEGVNCGWLLSDDSPRTAANAIRIAALTHPSELASRGQNGAAWASENLRMETFRERVQAFAEKIVAEARSCPFLSSS